MPDFVPPKSQETKPIKVELPKEPPKEVLDINFSLADMPKGEGSVAAPIQLPVTGEKKDGNAPTKEENKDKSNTPSSGAKDEQVLDKVSGVDAKPDATQSQILKPPSKDKPKEDKKVEVKKEADVRQIAPPDKSIKKERDYTGFSAEEVTHLKAMSNEAFAYATGIIKENKELAKLKDGSFLQHPDAYTLTPDYQQTVSQIQMADIEAQAWRTALINCEDGKKFQVPKGFDKNSGKLVLSEEMEPTAAFKVELANILGKVTGVQSNLQDKLSTMGNTFKQRVSNDRQAIEAERAKRFAWITKPEMLDWTVATVSGDVPIKTIKSDFINLFPPYDRNTAGTQVASDLMVAFLILEGELRNALAGKATADTKMEEVKRGEPSSDAVEREAMGEVHGVKEFSLAGLPR